MLSMYAKLFSRIAQSSLMELGVEVRYCFMMMLAIADPVGDVIGTDVAIARTLNLPLDTFKRCVELLMAPDPDSNSPENEGRRIIQCEHGRGYHLVNYVAYRSIKTEEEKRAYMRDYMKSYRKGLRRNDVKPVNPCKETLSELIQAEAESKEEDSTYLLGVLSEQTGRKFRPVESNLTLIRARLSEPGVTTPGVKQMILRQVAKWKGDPKMEEYLRPETLFAKSKFDSYYSARELPVLREQGKPAAPVLVGSLSAIVDKLIANYPDVRRIPGKDLLPVVLEIERRDKSTWTPSEKKLVLEQRAHRDAL